jgi:hypothetical protein
MDLKHCLHCSKSVKILRKGYCAACYARIQRNGTPEYEQINRRTRQTECSFCGKPGQRLVRGFCKACYYREKKNGDLEYRRVRTLCRVPGCDAVVKSDGLCGKHHLRVKKTGSTDEPRGGKTAHPQYERWQWYFRNKSMCDPRWYDFWNFADDVGEVPSTLHRLYRKDASLPYGPNNFEWRERNLDEAGSQKKAEYAKAWRAAYTLKNPRKFKNSDLLKRYGLTIEAFEKMLACQNNVCAICEQAETAVHQRTGEVRHLAVDHCHTNLNVRALLCTQCNRMIGLSRDRPELLRKAADYLEFHASQVTCDPPPEG